MVPVVLFVFLLANIQCAIIPTATATDRKCYGNFILVGTKCTACKLDEIAQNNVCVKLAPPQYGTNIKNVGVGLNSSNSSRSSQPVNNTVDSKCVQFNSTQPSLCIKCVGGYDVMGGKCVDQACRAYSQLLAKCIDNPTTADLLFLQAQYQPKPNNASNSSNEGYIIGVP